jgi:hypothetical protein
LYRPQGPKGDVGPIGLTGIQGVKGDKVIHSLNGIFNGTIFWIWFLLGRSWPNW